MAYIEVYKDIPLNKNYQVSNFGNVRSKPFVVIRKDGKKYTNKGICLKQSVNNNYLCVCIGDKKRYVHQLVALTFLNHNTDGTNKIVIDHLDSNKLNNKLENLQLVSNRHNCSKEVRGVSKYVGVSWIESRKRWNAQILINGKQTFLGRFINEYDAHLAYQNKLKTISI